jgi:hypothetical protein
MVFLATIASCHMTTRTVTLANQPKARPHDWLPSTSLQLHAPGWLQASRCLLQMVHPNFMPQQSYAPSTSADGSQHNSNEPTAAADNAGFAGDAPQLLQLVTFKTF